MRKLALFAIFPAALYGQTLTPSATNNVKVIASGTAPNFNLLFDFSQFNPSNAGAGLIVPTFSIGSVTSGSPAAATVTGSAASGYTLNLVLPTGSSSNPTALDASVITTGTLNLARLPSGVTTLYACDNATSSSGTCTNVPSGATCFGGTLSNGTLTVPAQTNVLCATGLVALNTGSNTTSTNTMTTTTPPTSTPSGYSGPTFGSSCQGSGTSCTLTVSAGDMIVAFANDYGAGTLSASDSTGGTFSNLRTVSQSAASYNGEFVSFVLTGATAGSHTVTFTNSAGGSYQSISAVAIHGATAVDVSAGNTVSSAPTPYSGSSVTTTGANRLLVYSIVPLGGGTVNAGSGYTAIAGTMGPFVEYQSVSAAGSVTPTVTMDASHPIVDTTVAIR